MIGADGGGVRTCFIATVGKRNRKRNFFHGLEELVGRGIVVAGIHAIHDQGMNRTTVHLFYQSGERLVVASALQ